VAAEFALEAIIGADGGSPSAGGPTAG